MEKEKITKALNYLKQLAAGIDPVSGKEIKNDSVLSNVELTRAFLVAADVLEETINGKKTTKKKPFALQDVSLIPLSSKPVTLSEFISSVNRVTEQADMKKLAYKNVKDWLVSQKYITETMKSDGKIEKTASEDAFVLGIFNEQRKGIKGEGNVILYNERGQKFILDNIEEIVNFKGAAQSQMKYEKSQDYWSDEEETDLVVAAKEGKDAAELARKFGRSTTAVRKKLELLGFVGK